VALSPFRFTSLSALSHCVTTRTGGVSCGPYASLNLGYSTDDDEDVVAANRDIVSAEMGIDPGNLAVAFLRHGTDVAVFKQGQPRKWPGQDLPVRPGSTRTQRAFTADAVISDVPRLHFLFTFADCVPLLFLDSVLGAMGAAHAGWRGTAAGMARTVVGAMAQEFGSRPENIRVGIGPSIGPCCYRVGPDVPAAFHASGNRPVMDGNRLDLWTSTVAQLEDAGVHAMEVSRLCTSCNTDRFFSHRRENGITGRFALVAGLRA
jgi:YfiH family protein